MRIIIIEDEPDVAAFIKKVLIEEKHAVDIQYRQHAFLRSKLF